MKAAIWGLPGSNSPNRSGVKLFQEPVCLLPSKENLRRDSSILEDYACTLSTRKRDNCSTASTTFVELENNYNNTEETVCRINGVGNDTSNKALSFRREKIFLNVRGRMYETFTETLARFPNTLLGCFEKREVYYETQKRQYSFGLRDASSFDAILFYYQSNGILCRPADVDSQTFYNEIRFFQLNESVIKVFLESEGLKVQGDKETKVFRSAEGGTVWEVLEYPRHSTVAQMFAVFSLLIICLSIIIFCGETLPSIRENPGFKSIFNSMEIFCVSWFTLEYMLRIIFSPNRGKFCLSAIGCIDVLAIVPFYVTTLVVEANINLNHEQFCCIFLVLKLLRVLRVLKFSRYVQGLNVLGQTLVKSSKELFFMFLCLLICSVLFASFAYFADSSRADTQIISVPDGIWFTIISLTCIGYGDIVPVTSLGKLNATFCALTGVVVLSIPMPVIVRNFTQLYYDKKEKEP